MSDPLWRDGETTLTYFAARSLANNLAAQLNTAISASASDEGVPESVRNLQILEILLRLKVNLLPSELFKLTFDILGALSPAGQFLASCFVAPHLNLTAISTKTKLSYFTNINLPPVLLALTARKLASATELVLDELDLSDLNIEDDFLEILSHSQTAQNLRILKITSSDLSDSAPWARFPNLTTLMLESLPLITIRSAQEISSFLTHLEHLCITPMGDCSLEELLETVFAPDSLPYLSVFETDLEGDHNSLHLIHGLLSKRPSSSRKRLRKLSIELTFDDSGALLIERILELHRLCPNMESSFLPNLAFESNARTLEPQILSTLAHLKTLSLHYTPEFSAGFLDKLSTTLTNLEALFLPQRFLTAKAQETAPSGATLLEVDLARFGSLRILSIFGSGERSYVVTHWPPQLQVLELNELEMHFDTCESRDLERSLENLLVGAGSDLEEDARTPGMTNLKLKRLRISRHSPISTSIIHRILEKMLHLEQFNITLQWSLLAASLHAQDKGPVIVNHPNLIELPELQDLHVFPGYMPRLRKLNRATTAHLRFPALSLIQSSWSSTLSHAASRTQSIRNLTAFQISTKDLPSLYDGDSRPLSNLETLSLSCADLDEAAAASLLSNLPLLSDLTILDAMQLRGLTWIRGSMLTTLSLNCVGLEVSGDEFKSLLELNITTTPLLRDLNLEAVNGLDLRIARLAHLRSVVITYAPSPIRIAINDCRKLLKIQIKHSTIGYINIANVPRVQEFDYDCEIDMAESESFVLDLPKHVSVPYF